MRMHLVAWALALTVLAVAGCGDGGPAGESDGGGLDGAPADSRAGDTGRVGCGDGVVQSGEVCDDGNTDDGDACRGDCASDYTCGNGVVDTVARGAVADEACDDGNTASGDGCSTDCMSDESCGNSIVDTAVGEVCDDGNTADGDTCSADCMMNLLCGNGMLDGSEECDDSNLIDGDGCNMSCQVERCGNMRVDAGEDCDDANTDDNDGCRADCTFTCSADAECDDADVCNGSETCADPGTATSGCTAGTPPGDGASCGMGLICNAGGCVAIACGDSIVSAPEACDVGNTIDGDGCDNDCTFTCSAAGDCDDMNPCNGTETCSMAGSTMSRCGAGMPAMDGTSCGGGRICRMGACTTAGCGDGVRTGMEQCDDGNMTNGDGCDADCTWTCTTATVATDCGDGNVCNGTETCTGSGTLMSRCGAGTPPAAGSSCGAGQICVMGACVARRCGDGFVTAPEQCDDGNTMNGDGCDADCTWTCTAATATADCGDGNLCNGAEVCTSGGTLMSRCGPGMSAMDGTTCDRDMMPATRDICRMGMCLASRCGDGYRDAGAMPAEQCDDGNTMNGDGCSATCTVERICGDGVVDPGEMCDDGGGCLDTFECMAAPDCSYMRVCTPARLCDGGSNDLNTCAVAADCPGGGTCRVATNTCTIGGRQGLGCFASSDCPNSGSCTLGAGAGRCGDGMTPCNMDSQCAAIDNMCGARSVDGCSSRCNVETVYRIVTAQLADPRVTYFIDVTGMVNTLIQDEIDAYGLNFLLALDPQVTSPAMPAGILNFASGDCTAAGCTGGISVVSPQYDTAGGTTVCLQPLTGTTNASIAENRPTASAMGNCYSTRSVTLTIRLAGIPITLQNAQVGAEFRAGSPQRLIDGLLMGFLPESVANATYLPSSVMIVGGRSLGSLLNPSDRDMLGAVRGWWLYLNFTATAVPIAPMP